MWKRVAALVGLTCVVGSTNVRAQTSVCVEVQVRAWADVDPSNADRDSADASEAEASEYEAGEAEAVSADASTRQLGTTEVDVVETPASGELPRDQLGDDEFGPERVIPPSPPATATMRRPVFVPPHYLRRLIEYRVTHMSGFEAVEEGCDHRLVVELYPLDEGWTAFARYTGTAREEKVDQVRIDEFPALAQRLTDALLQDRPLEETLTRRTVLREDSEGVMRRVRGRSQTRFSIGTEIILGLLPTARSAGTVAEHTFRASAPLSIDVGARSTYRAWALDAYLGVMVGTTRQSINGSGRGHADYTFGMTAALHFLRYVSPDAPASIYGGGGSSFQIHRYRILPGDTGRDDSGLVGGGLNIDLVLGYEVMRASALSFFVEIQAHLPTYGFDSENGNGRINAWLPAAVAQIGLLR